MSTVIGLLVVFAAVLGGFVMAGGPLAVLVQPSEFVVIGGAAAGTLLISSPGKVRGRVIAAFKKGLSDHSPTPDDCADLLKLLNQLFQVLRREGALALEPHVNEPEASAIFKQYPSVTRRHHAMTFLCDGLRQFVDGVTPDNLALLLDNEIETIREEEHQPIALLKSTGDSLPGLGIVAAVLGIVITMGHMDGPPQEIGHHVAAALVGTFLGILLCYGVLAPIASSVEMQGVAETRYLVCIKEGVVAAARGSNPALSIEFARRALFSDERPSPKRLAELLGKGG